MDAPAECFYLVSPHASVDVFRTVAGLASWAECKARAYQGKTKSGVEFFGLSDADMVSPANWLFRLALANIPELKHYGKPWEKSHE